MQGTIAKVAKPIESSTVTNKDAEIKVTKLFLVSKVQPSAPQVSTRASSRRILPQLLTALLHAAPALLRRRRHA